MKQLVSALLLAATISFPSALFAEGEIDCASSCPEGQVMVSFADGNTVQCSCAQEAAMDPTVADPEVDGSAVAHDE